MTQRFCFSVCTEAVFKRIFALLTLLFLMQQCFFLPIWIVGESMVPALRSGQLALVNRLAYCSRPPKRGDIVAVWTDRDLIIKRVVGLPGEEVGLVDGVFRINGQPLDERYVQFPGQETIKPARLRAEQFIVAGDNRSVSLIAIVDRARIAGRVFTCDIARR